MATIEQIEENARELVSLLADELSRLQETIGDEYRAPDCEPGDETPSMQVTLGATADLTGYALQTGDNSYMGAAYSFPYWGVATITRNDSPESLVDTAEDMVNQILEQSEFAHEV